MKPCRKHSSRTVTKQSVSASRSADASSVPVHRYSHPIRSKASASRDPDAQELLSGILRTLSRQSELLEELLRRTGTDTSDTK